MTQPYKAIQNRIDMYDKRPTLLKAKVILFFVFLELLIINRIKK